VHKAYVRGQRLRCSECSRFGATVGCYLPSWDEVFYYLCVMAGGCHFFKEQHVILCKRRKDQAAISEFIAKMGSIADAAAAAVTRREAVTAASAGDPDAGKDAPHSDVTGLRRGETEAIVCRDARISSCPPTGKDVTVALRTGRELGRGERLILGDRPMRVPENALECVFSRLSAAIKAPPSIGSSLKKFRNDGQASPRRSPFMLVRNLKQTHAFQRGDLRLSLPVVPPSYTHTVAASSLPPTSPRTARSVGRGEALDVPGGPGWCSETWAGGGGAGWLGTSRVSSSGPAGCAASAMFGERSPHDGGRMSSMLAAVSAAAALEAPIYPPDRGGTLAKESGDATPHLGTNTAGSRSLSLGSSPQGRPVDCDGSESGSDDKIELFNVLYSVSASKALAALTYSAAALAAPASSTTPRSKAGVPVVGKVLPSLTTAAAAEAVTVGNVRGIGGKTAPCAKPTTVVAATSNAGGGARALSHADSSAEGSVRDKAAVSKFFKINTVRAAAPTGPSLPRVASTGDVTAEVAAAEARTTSSGGGTSASAAPLPAVALSVAPRLVAPRALARPKAASFHIPSSLKRDDQNVAAPAFRPNARVAAAGRTA